MIHNPTSGDGDRPSAKKLVKWIRAAGHKIEYQSSKDKKWHKILKSPGDVVAVAGGDGLVSKVARRLVEHPVPMAIVPIGTANNIATTLGIAGLKVKDWIADWNSARCVHFDAATARGPWGSKHFIEGFGVGLFAETMFCLVKTKDRDLEHAQDSNEEIQTVLKILMSRLRKLRAHSLNLRLDGKDISGKYVLLEALNIGLIGPNLNLAPEADIQDGLLEVIAVPEAEREALERYLSKKLNGAESAPDLPRFQGRHLQLESEIIPLHIDDMGWPDDSKTPGMRSQAVSVKVDPGSLVFLQPKLAGPKRR